MVDQKASLPGIAERVSRLGTETAFDTLAQVNKLRAQGRDIISFGIGEPDFATPENIVAAAKTALDDGLTRYGPSDGMPELRAVIAAEVARMRGITVDPDQIVVAPGAKPFILYSIATLVNEGEEVLYPNPGFPIYESVIRWLGGKPVPMPLTEGNAFGCDRGPGGRGLRPHEAHHSKQPEQSDRRRVGARRSGVHRASGDSA